MRVTLIRASIEQSHIRGSQWGQSNLKPLQSHLYRCVSNSPKVSCFRVNLRKVNLSLLASLPKSVGESVNHRVSNRPLITLFAVGVDTEGLKDGRLFKTDKQGHKWLQITPSALSRAFM